MYPIDIEGLSYWYPESAKPAIQDISITVSPGECILLQGDTGSGKSTLIRAISGACPEFYGGHISGSVRVAGRLVSELSPMERVKYFGFVSQDPEAQSVYATAEREVAFALENLGVPARDMEWRVAEALDIVGLSSFAQTKAQALSGGQRQRLTLAASLVHQPAILLLDEPTSQLDPVASEEWFDTLRRLNDEFGFTIIMSEHRLDRAYPFSHRVIYMEQGGIAFDGEPKKAAEWLREREQGAVPTLARLGTRDGRVCLTVREARAAVIEPRFAKEQSLAERSEAGRTFFAQRSQSTASIETDVHSTSKSLITLHHVSCSYPDRAEYVLDECSLSIPSSGLTAVIGPNGAGKSTLLRVLCGLQRTEEGTFGGTLVDEKRRKRSGPKLGDRRIGYLPQNPNDLLSQDTVEKELMYSLGLRGVHGSSARSKVEETVEAYDLLDLRNRHPRDVSGGERMRVAIACVMVVQPDLVLLDEPTRGLDASQKRRLGERLRASDCACVIATHDMEFVAEYANQVVFLHQGRVVQSGSPRDVFRKALYFAPPIARALRHAESDILCLSDAIREGWAR